MDELTAERFGWVIPYAEQHARPPRRPRRKAHRVPDWVIAARRAVLCALDEDPVVLALDRDRRLTEAIRGWAA